MDDYAILVFGTLAMFLLVGFIIIYVLLYQRKIIKKNDEVQVMQEELVKQELATMYSVTMAQEQERKRLGRELHDNLASTFGAMKLYLDVLPLKPQEEWGDLLAEISNMTSQAATTSRSIAHQLDKGRFGLADLVSALESLRDTLNRSGKIKVDLIGHESMSIPSESSLEVFRIIQELTNNTLKHADARAIKISFSTQGKNPNIVFEDDGCGFDSDKIERGMGIDNLELRATQLCAELKISSSLGNGARFELLFPKNDADQDTPSR